MTCEKCGNPTSDGNRLCPGCIAGALNPRQNADPIDEMIGRTIDNKYLIEAKLGSGGMGTVYRAKRLLIGDSVAVKILHPDQVADSKAVERFRREAQASARLKHPNAVTIHDFGVSSDGQVYLVMEVVEGQSLREIIKQQGPLTPTSVAEIMRQACAALDEAHRNNIIHRDVKPDNIIVSIKPGGLAVKVLDFGIAKLRDLAVTASSLTQTGSIVGTPHYMSPEQCLGEELDHRSDIYSLGVVIYETLTGMVPFNSPTSAAIVVQQVTQPPPPLHSINLSISLAVEAVVAHALEKRREARPQTAVALAEELSAVVQGIPVSLPASRVESNAISFIPNSGGVAPALAPTMQMSVTSATSGSVTPASLTPLLGGPLAVQWPATGQLSGFAPRKKSLRLIAGIVLIGLIVAGVFIFRSISSPKRQILSEIKNGNLVKPDGGSAYDLYLKYAKNDLSDTDKREIAAEVTPPLKKRGEEIISQLKQEANESEGEWAEAIRVFAWLNDLEPGPIYDSRKFFSQARLEFLKKDYNKSLADYQRSMELDPAWALPLNGLGRVYINMKDKATARQYYTRATAADPNWVYPWINLGQLSIEMGDLIGAEDSLQHALSIDPQKASAHYLMGLTYEKMNRGCEAARELKIAVANVSNSPTTSFSIDIARSKMERLIAKYYCFAMGN
jgi:serine/threonine protein kinase